ncbi:MAG: CAP domain-containing protein [Candidatus Komeilibacteria bacterium]
MLRRKLAQKNKNKKQMNILNNKTSFIVSIAVTVSAICLLFFVTPGRSQSPSILETEINSQDLIILTNEIRDIKGLNPLTVNNKLTNAATSKAKHLIQHDYFSHNSPAGKQFSEWIIESGYNFQIIGENLAIGFATNKDVMKAWMDSPKHKENILNEKYNEIGLVVMQGDIDGNLETIIVQIFGAQPVLRLSEGFSEFIQSNTILLNHSYS